MNNNPFDKMGTPDAGQMGVPNTGDYKYVPDEAIRDPLDKSEESDRELIDKMKQMMEEADKAPAIQFPGTIAAPAGEEEENEKLLLDIDCVRDAETGEYHLIIKAGIRIGPKEILMKEKKDLSEIMFKRIKRLIDELNKMIKNKATLISLLK